VEIFADGVLIKNLDSVVDAREIFKLKDILGKRIFLIGSLVMTQNGKKIGLLEDFLFDTMFQNILTLTVKKVFSSEKRIISSERILSILPRRVIIRDTILKASMQKKLGSLDRLLSKATNS
jgi:sporulation protein YlmC with PRC-barrel domain